MPTTIHLHNGDSMTLAQSPQDIARQLQHAGNTLSPFDRSDGQTAWINPGHVVWFEEEPA